MIDNTLFDHSIWTQKARAFVTRSHRHLWGKNNEDPQAFLFTRGFKNAFIKKQMLGWNKFSQERPAKNWGDKTAGESGKKLFLPSGIVIPYIKEKQLLSVFIHPYDKAENTTLLPGNLSPTILLGDNKNRILILQNLFDGLFLFQELNQTTCVMIHPDINLPMETALKKLIEKAGRLFICSANKTEDHTNRRVFSAVPDNCFHTYSTKEQLIKTCT